MASSSASTAVDAGAATATYYRGAAAAPSGGGGERGGERGGGGGERAGERGAGGGGERGPAAERAGAGSGGMSSMGGLGGMSSMGGSGGMSSSGDGGEPVSGGRGGFGGVSSRVLDGSSVGGGGGGDGGGGGGGALLPSSTASSSSSAAALLSPGGPGSTRRRATRAARAAASAARAAAAAVANATPSMVAVTLLCGTWVIMSEAVQGLEDGWDQPWAITYTINSMYAIAAVPYLALRWKRTGAALPSVAEARAMVAGTAMDGMPVSPRQLLVLGGVMQLMCAFDQWTWFWSLHYTLVAANNAIYQSSAAFVFVISVALLGERVTHAKVLAVAVCVLGVCLVSFAPTAAADGTDVVEHVHQTVAGYVMVVVSTLGYSCYEVVFAKASREPMASWVDMFRARRRPLPAAGGGDDGSDSDAAGGGSSSDDGAAAGVVAAGVAGSGGGGDVLMGDGASGGLAGAAGGGSSSATGGGSGGGGGGGSGSGGGGGGGGDTERLLPATGVQLHGSTAESRLSRPGSPLSPTRGPGASSSSFGTSTSVSLYADGGVPALTLTTAGSGSALAAAPGAETPPPAGAVAAAVRDTLLRAEMALLVLTCMGVCTFLCMWPMFFVFHVTGIEPLLAPPPGTMRNLLAAAALDAVYQFALLFGISITSPLWMSVGSVLVVPASLVADWLLHAATVSAQAAVGIAFIIAGFLVLQFDVDPLAVAARAAALWPLSALRCDRRGATRVSPA